MSTHKAISPVIVGLLVIAIALATGMIVYSIAITRTITSTTTSTTTQTIISSQGTVSTTATVIARCAFNKTTMANGTVFETDILAYQNYTSNGHVKMYCVDK